jgi:hypothetical protein
MMRPMPTDRTEVAARHRRALEALGASVLDGPGVLSSDVRRAAAAAEGVPERFASLVDTIHRHAYRVTDRTVAELLAAGATEDEVFEIAVAAAYGAARRRLEAGLRALDGAAGGT